MSLLQYPRRAPFSSLFFNTAHYMTPLPFLCSRLVDLFSTPGLTVNIIAIKKHLLTYYSLLQSTHLTNLVLESLPLSSSLDPSRPVPFPSRLLTVSHLVISTLDSLIRLPLFFLPLVVHFPAYLMARVGAKLVEDEEETQAQNKVVFGLLFLFLCYPAAFFFVWAFLKYTPVGALIAAFIVFLFASYHTKLVNGEFTVMPRRMEAHQ